MVGIVTLILTLFFLHFYHLRIRKKIARIRETLDELASVEQNAAYGLVYGDRNKDWLYTQAHCMKQFQSIQALSTVSLSTTHCVHLILKQQMLSMTTSII